MLLFFQVFFLASVGPGFVFFVLKPQTQSRQVFLLVLACNVKDAECVDGSGSVSSFPPRHCWSHSPIICHAQFWELHALQLLCWDCALLLPKFHTSSRYIDYQCAEMRQSCSFLITTGLLAVSHLPFLCVWAVQKVKVILLNLLIVQRLAVFWTCGCILCSTRTLTAGGDLTAGFYYTVFLYYIIQVHLFKCFSNQNKSRLSDFNACANYFFAGISVGFTLTLLSQISLGAVHHQHFTLALKTFLNSCGYFVQEFDLAPQGT